jgi:hypothetical protein
MQAELDGVGTAPFVNVLTTGGCPTCGRPRYQCSPSFEPSAAAVIIAGIPIATVASAIARASIMTIPLEIGKLPKRLISSLRNRFRD